MPKTNLTCCYVCQLPKKGNRDKFYTAKMNRDGLTGRCKKCTQEAAKEYRQKPGSIKRAKEYRRRPENVKKAEEYRQRPENIEKAREYQQRPENARKARERRYLREYGLTLEQYNQLLDAQDGKCAICETKDPGGKGRLQVDHCHTTGKIRGLLCHHCNTMLGQSKDSVETLKNAIKYLER